MTRKEMIKHMAFFYDQLSDPMDLKTSEQKMEDVLSIIEQSGMMNTSQYGAVCSRCDLKGYDHEEE